MILYILLYKVTSFYFSLQKYCQTYLSNCNIIFVLFKLKTCAKITEKVK